jgi:hypothetical protein
MIAWFCDKARRDLVDNGPAAAAEGAAAVDDAGAEEVDMEALKETVGSNGEGPFARRDANRVLASDLSNETFGTSGPILEAFGF